MAYTTQAQVEIAAGGATRLRQICDQDGNGSLDATVLAQAQLMADALINGHATLRFAELLNSDDEVVDTAIALASMETVYQLKCMHQQNSANDDRLAEARLSIYEKIANGTFRPSEPAPVKSTAVASEWVEREDEDDDGYGTVTRETLKGVAW